MAAAEEGLKALGCPKFNLQVRSSNAAVIAFYEQLGYSIEDRASLGKVLD
jgi:ribosomal protein S18 acetylase RimI-like enzyme